MSGTCRRHVSNDRCTESEILKLHWRMILKLILQEHDASEVGWTASEEETVGFCKHDDKSQGFSRAEDFHANFRLNIVCHGLLLEIKWNHRISASSRHVILRLYSFLFILCILRPPLWSSGQSSWLQIQSFVFESRLYQIFLEVVWAWNGVHSASWVQLRSYLKEKAAAPV
jgi:hypothetical protein